MFEKKNRQKSLFEVDFLLSKEKLSRLKQTWAGFFRRKVLPLIDEEKFRDLYDEKIGAPNKPVQTVIGLLIIKELFDYTDQEVLSALEFDLKIHYALELSSSEAHTCQKTLHNFRAKLTESGRHQALFEDMTTEIAEAVSLSFEEQRLDSTHIVSNMAILTRLGLFVKTIEQFLNKLKRMDKTLIESLPKRFRERYLEREGYFADSRSSHGRRRLDACAKDLWYLVDRFRDDQRVSELKHYRKLVRLFKEQCEVVGSDELEPVVRLKPAKQVSSNSMQSPSDEDATYSGHKGKGYSVQIAETCSKDNPFQVITQPDVHGAHISDEKTLLPTVDKLDAKGQKPKELCSDAGYISGEKILACAERGVNLKGPVKGKSPSPEKMELASFSFSESGHKLRHCPGGYSPLEQGPSRTGRRLTATFRKTDCLGCSFQDICPTKELKRDRKLYWTPAMVATSIRRVEQQTPRFKKEYRIRSGSEATGSELKRAHGMGRLRVRGQPAVELAVFFKALACNCKRYLRYLQNEMKKAQKASNEAIFASISLKNIKTALQNYYYTTEASLSYAKAA